MLQQLWRELPGIFWRQCLEYASSQVKGKAVISRFYPRPGASIDNKEQRPYLYRFYLAQGWWGSLFLHKIVGSDNGPEIHNHPWNLSCSLILAGAYVEERLVGSVMKRSPLDNLLPVTFFRTLTAGSLNVIRKGDFHRLQVKDNLQPGEEVWTLFYHTPTRVQNWGFLYPDGTFHPVVTKVRSGTEAIDPKATTEDDE